LKRKEQARAATAGLAGVTSISAEAAIPVSSGAAASLPGTVDMMSSPAGTRTHFRISKKYVKNNLL
jgi:hypothetical protein